MNMKDRNGGAPETLFPLFFRKENSPKILQVISGVDFSDLKLHFLFL